jgi:hypothetical protein
MLDKTSLLVDQLFDLSLGRLTMSRRLRRWIPLGVAAVLAGLTLVVPLAAHAGVQPSSFISFDAFMADVSRSDYSSLAAAGRAGAVHDQRAFKEMRSYILDTYRGVKVTHSYLTDGSYFDCVTEKTQPGVRQQGITNIAAPPPFIAHGATAKPGGVGAPSPLTLGLRDRFGHAVSCPPGTIPMQRISLDRLTRFGTLAAYRTKPSAGTVAKRAAGTVAAGTVQAQLDPEDRRYAIGHQYVDNHGANSWLNLWDPAANFSISQQWITAGFDTAHQTIEGGWIKYPSRFGSKSVLFIFTTPDKYHTNCYNLECGKFVQTNRNWALGGSWTAYSTPGGTQYGFQMQWKLSGGNWWLFLQGAGAFEAVGYYPASAFNGGALTNGAQFIQFGGETGPTTTMWPPMGSGQWASAGYGQAAFQRTIFYIGTDDRTVWPTLDTEVFWPMCYSIEPGWDSSWGTYFYFGGPGGPVCAWTPSG